MQTEISFHNSLQFSGPELETTEVKTYTQDQLVLHFFQQHPDQDFTPAEVYAAMKATGTINELTPITSIRRAMCNLTTACYLFKTQNKRAGIYGMVNFTWKLNTNN
jgi:hypothetical protein